MTDLEKGIFNRSELLLGAEGMHTLEEKKVIIFGVGGVGSWCAESLIRTGLRHLTIVDSDRVSITNCNRQLMATTKTVGEPKVEVLKKRLLEISPYAEINALEMIYEKETADSFHIEEYDYVVDAIDSLKDKIQLIIHTTNINANENNGHRPTLFSSMGAALRIDPTKITVAEFWKVRNDPLGAALRKRMRQKGLKPGCKFKCVYSEELPMQNLGDVYEPKSITIKQVGVKPAHDWNESKAQINGSLAHITGIFGFTLAGLILSDITNSSI